MPNAIITAIMFVGNLVMTALPIIEVVFGISGTTFFVTGALAITAGVVGMSKLMEMSLPRPDSNYARQKTVRSTTAPVKRVYGESLISGPVAFMGVGGTGNQDLWHVIALTGDKSEAITDIYLDNIIIPNADINSGNSAGGIVNGTSTIFKPIASTTLVTVYKYTGGQTAASMPVTSEFFKWTSDHEGQGLTYIATKFSFPDNEKIAEIWNKYNPQDIKALVKGMAIYDPRKDSTSPEYDSSLGVSTQRLSDSTTWQWSDNPALCLANYIADDQFGMGVPSSAIDWAAVHSSADYADALVSIPGSQTQKRFTCNGVLYGTDSHAQNINKILSSMNGSLVYSSGKYVMQAGQYIEPESDAILTDDDLNGPINITVANTRDDRFNTIKGTHFNPQDLHKKVAFPEVQLTDIATRDAGEVLYKEVELPMTNDVYMCQRLTYQMINRSNDQLLIEFPCNLKALRYTVGDRVKITLDKFAGSDQDSISFNQTPFVILGFNFSAEGAVTLTMLKDTQANYTDMPAANYSTIASDGSITDGFSGVPAPTNLSSVVIGHDVRLTWDNPVPNTTFNDIIVYQSATSNFSESSILLRTKNDAITFVLPTSALTRYYWVRASLYDNEVAATDIIIGQTYRIRSLGTTSWTTLGATAPVSNGDTFLATASGTSSSGTGVATDESAVSAVVGPETVTTTDQVADSVEWIDVDDSNLLRPANNATVGATLGTDVYDGQAQAYAVGDLLNSNGFFRFTRTSADDNVDAPASAAAFNTAFGRAPTDGDIVVVTNTTSSPNKQAAYQYDGSTFGTISGFFAGDLIIDDTITAAALSVDELGAITADLGTITGGTLKGGTVPDADAAPSDTESGSFFDLTGGKFVVGNATNNLLFDSSALTVTGTVNASAGAFTGDVSTDSKFIAGSGNATTVLDGSSSAPYRIFSGAAVDQSENASFKVLPNGSVFASNITVYDADGNILLDQSGLGAAALSGISLAGGSLVDKVSGVLYGNTDELILTLDVAATVTVTTKLPIYSNASQYLYFYGSGASEAAALSDITNSIFNVIYNLKTDAGSYAIAATKPISFTSTSSTPSSTQIYVEANYIGGGIQEYRTVLMNAGGALEYIANSLGTGATAYVLTSHTFTNLAAGVHKIKLSSTVTGTGSPTAFGQDSSARLYEVTSASVNFVENQMNSFANGSNFNTNNIVLTGTGGTRSISWRDTDTSIDAWRIEAGVDTDEAASTTMNFRVDDGATTPVSFVDNGNILITGDFYTGSGAVTAATANISGDINLKAANSDVGINWVDSDDSVRAWSMYANPNQPSTLYIEYNPDGAGTSAGWAFVNNGNFLAAGSIYADGAASNSTQWKTGYDYSQIGHLPLTGGTISQNLTITGDLTVSGTTTTVNTDNLTVKDNNITLNYSTGDSSSTANDSGITIQDAVNSTTDASILWKTATDRFEFSHAIYAPAATFTGNVETKIIDQYQEFAAGNGDHEVQYFSKVLATYSENNASQTYIILTTTVPQSSFAMGGFQLTFWDKYPTSTSGDVIDIYGYWNPENNGGFTGFRYNSKNPNFEPTIQVGANSSGYTVFILSNFGTSSYAQLVAKDFWSGYSSTGAARSWGQGWSFSTSNTISAYTNLDTLGRNGVTSAQITNLSTAYNYSQVGHLPLAGGTLTGALSGTSGTFTGAISGASFELSGISVIDSNQNINAASISTDAITSAGDITLTSTTTSSPSINFNSSTATDPSIDMAVKLVGEELHFYEPEDNNKVHFKIYDDTGVDAPFGYWVNGTRMADASRNLTVGTISSGIITATDGTSTNWNTAYTYSQVGHLPLGGGTVSAQTFFLEDVAWKVGGSDAAHQRADARDDATSFARLHWYGVADNSATSNFRHAWYDGAAYINVTAASGTVTFGGNIAATNVSVADDLKFTGTDNYIWSPNTTSGFVGFYDPNNNRVAAKYQNDTGGWGLLGEPASGYALKVHGAISSGSILSGAINSISAIGAADDVRTGLIHYDSTAMAAGVGGQLVLGYKYLSTGEYTAGAILKTYKENATSNHYGSGLKFQVRNTGSNLSTKMTLNPSGNLSVTGEVNFGSSRFYSSISANTGGGNYEFFIQPDANNTHQWRIISGGTGTAYGTGVGGLGFLYQASGVNNADYNFVLNSDGTSTFNYDAYANKHLHVGKSGGWLQLYDDGGVGNTVSKGNLYFDATTKEFRFYSAVLSTGAAESTATLKRYNGSAYESIYDTGSGVPWADINAGVRTNFTIGFKPATSNYAGLLFQDEDAGNAGYLLVRANSDVAPVYKANGIHLIADAGYLSLVSRTTTNTGVRILSGAVPAERMVFKSDGEIDQPNAIWERTYHQEHAYASGHAANTVHTHWGVLAAGSHSGVPSTYTIIQTNVSQDAYRMGGFTLLVMDAYGDSTQRERIDLAGYWNPESNGGFIGWGYTTTNPSERPTIQVMRNSSTGKVAFAYSHTSGGSTGSYPVIVACDLWLGWSNAIQDDGRDWSMIGAGNLTGYTNIDTVNYAGGNGNYQKSDGQFVISKAAGTMLSHGSFIDAIGYSANYGTYIGANNRYVYSGIGTHPVFAIGTAANNILHNGGQIANTYNGDHTFTTTTSSAGIKVTNNQSGGPALKIHNTATGGTDWWLISNGASNEAGAGKLQLWSNNNGFTTATFGETSTDITKINTQTQVQTTAIPPNFTTTTSGPATPALLANSNGFGAHALVVNQTQSSHWAQIISTQGYGLYIDNHASSTSNDLFRAVVGGTTQFYIRGDGTVFSKQAVYIGDSTVYGVLKLNAGGGNGGTIDAYAPNGSYVHSDVRDNGTWSMAHKYTYKDGAYGTYTENWWDGSSYHQLGSINNAIRTNGDFVASGNITAYGSYSDRRLKENVRPFENARDLIKDINVHRFNYIGKDDDLIGVIAQEVEETLPQLVYELIDTDSEEVRKAVRYDHLSAVLLKAVKEQDEEIKELQEMVRKLMEKIQ